MFHQINSNINNEKQNSSNQDINSLEYEGNHLYFNISICTQKHIKYTHTNL